MRGKQPVQTSMLALVDLNTRVPSDHPLRTIKHFADQALAQLSSEFDRLYAQTGRLSIPLARATQGGAAQGPVLGPQRAGPL